MNSVIVFSLLVACAIAAPFQNVQVDLGPLQKITFREHLHLLPRSDNDFDAELSERQLTTIAPSIMPTTTPGPISFTSPPSMEPSIAPTALPSPVSPVPVAPSPVPASPLPSPSAGLTGDKCASNADCTGFRKCVVTSGVCPWGTPCRCSPTVGLSCVRNADCPVGEVCATDGLFSPICLSTQFVTADPDVFPVGTETL